jgi:hypothetical protein
MPLPTTIASVSFVIFVDLNKGVACCARFQAVAAPETEHSNAGSVQVRKTLQPIRATLFVNSHFPLPTSLTLNHHVT